MPLYVSAVADDTTWYPVPRISCPLVACVSSFQGLPGVLSVPSVYAATTPTTTSLAWLSVPVEPDVQVEPPPSCPAGAMSVAAVRAIPDHSMTHAAVWGLPPDPPVMEMTTDVCPPAQFGHTQMAALMCALL